MPSRLKLLTKAIDVPARRINEIVAARASAVTAGPVERVFAQVAIFSLIEELKQEAHCGLVAHGCFVRAQTL
jgi:hypothetical protein